MISLPDSTCLMATPTCPRARGRTFSICARRVARSAAGAADASDISRMAKPRLRRSIMKPMIHRRHGLLLLGIAIPMALTATLAVAYAGRGFAQSGDYGVRTH